MNALLFLDRFDGRRGLRIRRKPFLNTQTPMSERGITDLSHASPRRTTLGASDSKVSETMNSTPSGTLILLRMYCYGSIPPTSQRTQEPHQKTQK